MRTGLWVSGAGGSGVLVGRKADGAWSQPVGIMLHTAGLGFLVGVDIYDCVLVINTEQALNAFSRWRCTVGGEISAVAGPLGVGGVLETEVHKRQAPVFNYLKSRGFYAGVQIDGTVVLERTDEDERFYGQKISAKDILAGKAQSRLYELRTLMETLKSAQGDSDVDKALLPAGPPPADYDVVEDGHVFGVPDKEDPDPYGVFALEKQGLLIKEAGSQIRASSDQFDFKPSVTSPIYDTFRKSLDSNGTRNSFRRSTMSTLTLQNRSSVASRDKKYVTSDVSTQTDFDTPSVRSLDLFSSPPVGTTTYSNDGASRPTTRASSHLSKETNDTEAGAAEHQDLKFNGLIQPAPSPSSSFGGTESHTASPISPIFPVRPVSGRKATPSASPAQASPMTPSAPNTPQDSTPTENEATKTTASTIPAAIDGGKPQQAHIASVTQPPARHDQEVVIQSVRHAARPTMITKPRVVQVAKPVPPKLPERNPGRSSRTANGPLSRTTSEDQVPRQSQQRSENSSPVSSRAPSVKSVGSFTSASVGQFERRGSSPQQQSLERKGSSSSRSAGEKKPGSLQALRNPFLEADRGQRGTGGVNGGLTKRPSWETRLKEEQSRGRPGLSRQASEKSHDGFRQTSLGGADGTHDSPKDNDATAGTKQETNDLSNEVQTKIQDNEATSPKQLQHQPTIDLPSSPGLDSGPGPAIHEPSPVSTLPPSEFGTYSNLSSPSVNPDAEIMPPPRSPHREVARSPLERKDMNISVSDLAHSPDPDDSNSIHQDSPQTASYHESEHSAKNIESEAIPQSPEEIKQDTGPRISLANMRGGLGVGIDDGSDGSRSRSISRSRSPYARRVEVEDDFS